MAVLTKYILMYPLDEEKSLAINSLTSAMDIIDKKTRTKIENKQGGIKNIELEEDEELYQQLKNRGYLFEDEHMEQETINRYRMVNLELTTRKLNTNFTICPTMGCNLRCTYCFESNEQHVNYNLMTDDQLDGIFKYISETLESTKEDRIRIIGDVPATINVFGGEPLLKTNFHVISRILEYANANKMVVKIITNGTTIQPYLELFKQYANLLYLQITVDGDKQVHDVRRIRANGTGSFDQICRNINRVLMLDIMIALRINVDKANIKSLRELEAVIKANEWDKNPKFYPYASPVLDFCGVGEDILAEHELLDTLLTERLYGCEEGFIKGIVSPSIGYLSIFFNSRNKMKPWKLDYCEATSGSNFGFSPDGNITTCLTYAGKGKHTIGTFDKDGVRLNVEDTKRWLERSIFRIEKCQDCKYAFLCGGGCAVAAIENNQDIDDAVCSDIANTIERYVFHMKHVLLNQ